MSGFRKGEGLAPVAHTQIGIFEYSATVNLEQVFTGTGSDGSLRWHDRWALTHRSSEGFTMKTNVFRRLIVGRKEAWSEYQRIVKDETDTVFVHLVARDATEPGEAP